MNGGLHIKQENMMSMEHPVSRDPEQIHHVIKRELHTEYDEMEHEPQNESMAEDLTVTPDQTNILDA